MRLVFWNRPQLDGAILLLEGFFFVKMFRLLLNVFCSVFWRDVAIVSKYILLRYLNSIGGGDVQEGDVCGSMLPMILRLFYLLI